MIFTPLRSLAYGFSLPYKALRLIASKRSLLVLSIIPIGLTLLLYLLVIHRTQIWLGSQFHTHLVAWGLSSTGWVTWLLEAVAKLILILIGILAFTFMSSIVASPFSDLLAEQAERYSTPPLPRVPHAPFRERIRLIWIDLVKTLAATVMGLIALLVSWVPALNIIGLVLAFLLISFQYLSYPQTRRGWKLSRGSFFVLKHFFLCLGFGFSISILFSVPFLSSFALPLAVVGGTLLFARTQS